MEAYKENKKLRGNWEREFCLDFEGHNLLQHKSISHKNRNVLECSVFN